MSRHITNQPDGTYVAYGFDHAIGYFFDKIRDSESDEIEDKYIIEESSVFTRMSNGKMIELMKEHNCSAEHAQLVALDLEIP